MTKKDRYLKMICPTKKRFLKEGLFFRKEKDIQNTGLGKN